MTEAISNYEILKHYVPEEFDGDTFYYTEILDRSKKAGNNKGRRLRTYYHRDRAEFEAQMPQIIEMCEYFKARAYFRPSSRSFKKVGQAFAKHLIEQVISDNWEGMRYGYSSVCGKTRLSKVWLFDFDEFGSTALSNFLIDKQDGLVIPSKKGYHILTKPFDKRLAAAFNEDVSIHLDNPTNLYIPGDKDEQQIQRKSA